MECAWVRERLADMVSGELDASDEPAVETHCRVCSDCSREREMLLAGWNALDVWEDAPPPGGMKKDILRRVTGTGKGVAPWLSFRAAAAILLVVGAVVFSVMMREDTGRRAENGGQRLSLTVHSGIPADEEEEIVANLELLEDAEFFSVLDLLEGVDYLPLVEEGKTGSGDTRSMLGWVGV